MIDDSICGLYETTAEDTSTLERLPLDDEAKKFTVLLQADNRVKILSNVK